MKITESPKPRLLLAAGYAVTMGLSAFIHTSAALIVVGHAICWLLFVFFAGRSQRSALWAAPAAFVMAGLLALALYAPVLGDMLRALGQPSNAGAKIEWTNPLWFAAETLRGLGRGLPGGWAVRRPVLPRRSGGTRGRVAQDARRRRLEHPRARVLA